MTARSNPAAVCLLSLLAAAAQVAAQIAPLPYTAVPPPAPEATRSATSAPNAPTAILRGFSLANELDPAALRQATEVSLEPGYPDLVLSFDATPATPNPEFRYRLNGFDPNYTLTRDRHAHYRRLPPGHFVFEVQAHTPGEPWSTALATLLGPANGIADRLGPRLGGPRLRSITTPSRSSRASAAPVSPA